MSQEEKNVTQEEKDNLLKKVLKMNDLEHTSNKLFTKFDELVSNQQVLMICIAVAAVALIIFKYAFKDNKYTCENFALNIYIYVLMAILIIALVVVTVLRVFPNSNLISLYKFAGNKYYLLFYIIILLFIIWGLIGLLGTHKYNILLSHCIWIILLVIFGLLFVPLYVSLKSNNLFMKTFLSTGIVVVIIILTIIYKKDLLTKYLTDESYNYVIIALMITIIAKILAYFILDFNIKELKDIRLYFAYILVVIFTYLLLYDTKQILDVTADDCNTALLECNDKTDIIKSIDIDIRDKCSKYPSYPVQSFNIFADIINMFQQIGIIYSSGE